MYPPNRLVQFFLDHPLIVGAFGWVFAAGCLFWGILFLVELLNMPKEPIPMSIEQAAIEVSDQEIWVVLEGGYWDCPSIAYDQSGDSMATEAMFIDGSESIIVVVRFNEKLACVQLPIPVSGTISLMSDSRYSYFSNANRLAKYEQATVFLEMCAFCGRAHSISSVVLSFLMAAVGLSLYPLCRHARNQYREEYLILAGQKVERRD
jgi:hypothetical protein